MRHRPFSDCPDAPLLAPAASSADLKRRRFLLSLGASGACAAAAAMTALPAAAQTPDAERADQDAGYRETEHVRDYYRTARI